MQILLNYIEGIIKNYTGHPPLAIVLKSFFKDHPKLGSRDRRAINEAVYTYFRYAKMYQKGAPALSVVASVLSQKDDCSAFLKKIFSTVEHAGLSDMQPRFEVEFSPAIDSNEWLAGLKQQPNLFIRARQNVSSVLEQLREKDIAAQLISTRSADEHSQYNMDCISLPNGKSVDSLLNPAHYVVQDWASQRSMHLVMEYLLQSSDKIKKVWDVCSGAGGKSILLKDTMPSVQVVATDIRASILQNLKQRFRTYGLSGVQTYVVDGTSPQELSKQMQGQQFDAVLCDVPCSGSGTWARTPEQYHFFGKDLLQKFAHIQFPIAYNALSYLKPGGLLCYITCSVFRAENENVVNQLIENTSVELLHQELINGIDKGADCMFVAVMRKK